MTSAFRWTDEGPIRRALVVTTVFSPTSAIRALAKLAGWTLVVAGDRGTPEPWTLDGAAYLSVEDQSAVAPEFAAALPLEHYGRKNVGYLYAIARGAEVIAETDDDNIPMATFLADVKRSVRAPSVTDRGWVNAYTHFTDEPIWPRGFPLDEVLPSLERSLDLTPPAEFDCPVQQHLADGDPDVDAVYRLTRSGDVAFSEGALVLPEGSFCPFNSQNTIWWPPAFPLLYLPGHVSFRMADIWRSFVAQVCLHAIGVNLAFGGPTVRHERHAHPLIADFEQELDGYLGNRRIIETLEALDLEGDPGRDVARCYEALVREGIVPPDELELLRLWLWALAGIEAG